MSIYRIQLDISSDIFDKVMFFLENLPKNKVKLNFKTDLNQKNTQNQEKDLIFGDFLRHSQQVNSIKKPDRGKLHER